MSTVPDPEGEAPLTPEQARLVGKLGRLSLVSAVIMGIGFLAVFGVIGYRLFGAERSAATFADVTAALPRGATVVSTAVAGERLVVTIEVGGGREVRTYRLGDLKPAGRLRFVAEP